ncbi:MAG: sugar phosphate isomerase/epimerase [Magnetococcales bacterium]|nr:sugar phosphate isomerase/epimerase [Magnetococcales bacterium]
MIQSPAIAIMQGRLSPPFEGRFQAFPASSWREEFFRAREAELAGIEWIFEVPHADDNPMASDTGLDEMRRLIAETGVAVRSICADYYMDAPLVKDGVPVSASIAHLKWLMSRAAQLNITYIILPCVDQSSLRSEQDRRALQSVLSDLLPVAESMHVELHLETDLPPTIFSQLLAHHNHPNLRANYDIGNSASLGFDPAEEMTLLAPWLGSVHVKDRLAGGGTVPLGRGAADFPTCFRQIRQAGFNRWFVLQVARGPSGEEVSLARANRNFVVEQWNNLILQDAD